MLPVGVLACRISPRAGLVTSRQTFVRRCHGGWLRNDLGQRGRITVPEAAPELGASAPPRQGAGSRAGGLPATLAPGRPNASLALPWRSGGEAGWRRKLRSMG